MMKESFILIAGLGNPGEKYAYTPHNLGFLVIDEFARAHAFPAFKMAIDGLLLSEHDIGETPVVLAKPQTFMNNSGREIAKLLKLKKLSGKKSYTNLWVVNDDFDLPFGKIRIGKNRGGAGHRGVQSIIDHLKTKNFVRFRIGIKQAELAQGKIVPEKFVLKAFKKTDEPTVEALVQKTAAAIEIAIRDGFDKAMTEFNR